MLHPPDLSALPGEIRNRIYEYALTCSTELRYIEDVTAKQSKPILYQAPQDCTCIGGYVMVEEYTIPRKCVLHAKPTEFNQLKYVNRKLYEETAGLELKLNPLVFRRATDSVRTCGEQLVDFLQCLSPKFLPWLNKIFLNDTLRETESLILRENPETLMLLDRFCSTYTHIEMRYSLPKWRLCTTNANLDGYECFFSEGLCISYALRRDDHSRLFQPHVQAEYREKITQLFHEDGDADEELESTIKRWVFERLERLVAPNMRFVPSIMNADGMKTTELEGLAPAFSDHQILVPDTVCAQVER